jgi:hypothetical protein
VADACKYGDESSGSINVGNLLTGWEPVRFSGRTVPHVVS